MGPHPGSKTSYPNSTAVRSRKPKPQRMTRHDTLNAGPFELREDHLKGSTEDRLVNAYKKTGTPPPGAPWPVFRGRGFANTFYR